MVDIIEVDLSRFDPLICIFIDAELDKCRSNGVPVTMPMDSTVLSKGFPCAGFFDDDPLEFAVAAKGSVRSWLPTFVHESCHLDQWLEKSKLWTHRINGQLPSNLFDAWLKHDREFGTDEIQSIIDAIVAIELDCEQRSIDKICKHPLPIRTDSYIRKSNAYIYSYRVIQETRNWDHSSAYLVPKIWKRMPAHFQNDYSHLPDDLRAIFKPVLDELVR
jgi:hypothetical protein